MKKIYYIFLMVLFPVVMFTFCQRKMVIENPKNILELKKISENVFGVKPENIIQEGTQFNLIGFRTTGSLVSMRTDSRTFFVQDDNYGSKKKGGIYQADDETIKKHFQDLLKKLFIPATEVKETAILQENLQTAKIDRSTKNFEMQPIEKGAKVLRASRAIDNIPVFNSNVTLALTKNETVGFLELHWPVISPNVVNEAKALSKLIKERWKAPEVPQAKVDSVEAGIIHSSAIAQLMDIKPVIRVIYTSIGGNLGRKAVYYYDKNSKPVALPREFLKPIQENFAPRKK